MITSNFIHRVFRIKHKNSIGTAFAVHIKNKEYLITAQHIVTSFTNKDEIGIWGNGDWQRLPAKLVGHAPKPIDISVVALEKQLVSSHLPVSVSSDGLAYGQEIYFLGFPYNVLGNVAFTEEGYPLPFAKHGILSMFDEDRFLLDGHNNPGFSGGPVIFGPPGTAPTSISAVISGYRITHEPIWAEKIKTYLTYQYNTGIIVSYKIEHAVSIINSNPIGFVCD